MGRHDKLIAAAIAKVQGRRLPLGSKAGHPDDSICRELVAYEDSGETAVLSWDGTTKRWPASEIYEPNEAGDVAIRMKIEEQCRFASNAMRTELHRRLKAVIRLLEEK